MGGGRSGCGGSGPRWGRSASLEGRCGCITRGTSRSGTCASWGMKRGCTAWERLPLGIGRWCRRRRTCVRRFGAKVGKKCIIRRTVRVYYPWNVEIGDLCIVGDEARLYSLGKITLGDRSMVSQEAYLCAGTHDYTEVALPLLRVPVTVGKEAWVCARAFIGPGVTVGEGAVVAAGAVVVKDVEP